MSFSATNSTESSEIAKKLSHLDLDPIKIKLMDPIEGEGWSREMADKADIMYRRFLYISVKYPKNIIVPSKVVDKFWHTHILDTKKYYEDCQHLFGKFLHHFPYLGMRGEEDQILLQDAFEETNNIFLSEFKEVDVEANQSSVCNSPANCWPAKCSSKCNTKRTEDTKRPSFSIPSAPVDIFQSSLKRVSLTER